MTATTKTPAPDIAALLLTHAQSELQTPEGRERLSAALRKTLRAIEPRGCCVECDAGDRAAAKAAMRSLDEAVRQSARATEAIERAEVMVDKLM